MVLDVPSVAGGSSGGSVSYQQSSNAGTCLPSLEKPIAKRARENDPNDGDELAWSSRKRIIHESDMPWYKVDRAKLALPEYASQRKTQALLKLYSQDIEFVEQQIRFSITAPADFPASEWRHILKGEPVDLDVIHRARSAQYTIDNSLSIVQTSSDWRSVWYDAREVTTFAFPHREEELRKWGSHISQLFRSLPESAHHKVIAFDRGVRSRVKGGQAILLDAREELPYFIFLVADPVELREEKQDSRRVKSDAICYRFNGARGCRMTPDSCRYRHACSKCEQFGHNKHSCTRA